MFDNHASDCRLHRAPARIPGPCNCGALTTDSRSQPYQNRLFCNLSASLESLRLTGLALTFWLHETFAIRALSQILAKPASWYRHRDLRRGREAQRSDVDRCNKTPSSGDPV